MTVLYTADHEWLRLEQDGRITVGITEYAQDALGDVVFVQLPELQAYAKGEEVAVLESVKAASNIVMPLDGEVVEINPQLVDSPELVNESPLDRGWFFRMQLADTSVLDGLLDQAGYENLLKANG